MEEELIPTAFINPEHLQTKKNHNRDKKSLFVGADQLNTQCFAQMIPCVVSMFCLINF